MMITFDNEGLFIYPRRGALSPMVGDGDFSPIVLLLKILKAMKVGASSIIEVYLLGFYC
jgi:hypothetical protein